MIPVIGRPVYSYHLAAIGFELRCCTEMQRLPTDLFRMDGHGQHAATILTIFPSPPLASIIT
jgi:hypothetical protein